MSLQFCKKLGPLVYWVQLSHLMSTFAVFFLPFSVFPLSRCSPPVKQYTKYPRMEVDNVCAKKMLRVWDFFPKTFLKPLIPECFLFVCFFLFFCLQEESSYINGKAIHKITVIPKVNLTVTCTVSNKLGEDVKTINVSSGKLLLVNIMVAWLYISQMWKIRDVL